MPDSVLQFYEDLSGDYHLLFGDWKEAVPQLIVVLNRGHGVAHLFRGGPVIACSRSCVRGWI